jgi:hypothetical protein
MLTFQLKKVYKAIFRKNFLLQKVKTKSYRTQSRIWIRIFSWVGSGSGFYQRSDPVKNRLGPQHSEKLNLSSKIYSAGAEGEQDGQGPEPRKN